MEYVVSLLIFLAGSIAGVFYYKSRLKGWSNRLKEQLDALSVKGSDPKMGSESIVTDQLPEEFSGVVSSFQSALSKYRHATGTSEPKPDGHIGVLRKEVDNLYIVNELGRKVTSSLNLAQTFHHLYATINSMMDAAVLELEVFEEPGGERTLYSNLLSGSEAESYENNMAAWSRKNNREVFLSDAERDFARYVFQPLVLPLGQVPKSVMVFPVLKGDQVTGTLSVLSFKQGSFETYHQEIIRSLLGYISVAIENALTHDELNRTKIRAEQSEKFKEQFLANMSHEIRTPINAVTGMTRLLIEKNPREDQIRYLESIRNASDSLLVIINDILDLSKIEAGKIELERIDFSVDEVLKNVRDIMHFKAEEKGLTLDVRCDNSIPPVLAGDPTRLSQVLINLVGNAIKFTEKGGVTISVIAREAAGEMTGDSKVMLDFSITDTGIGMTEEQQGRLFMEYTQASSDTARKYGGTGLGLSISRQLVQLQGGSISVKSVPGAGSTFSFFIPYEVSRNRTIATRQSNVSDEMIHSLKGIRVLLADDNEYNRIVARETIQLKTEDVIIDEAADGLEAVELVKRNRYDVVLMDLVMPGMSGLEATRFIRSGLQAPAKDVPILALTASVIKSEIDRCMAAGMNGFVAKPFKPLELLGAMYQVMHGTEISMQQLPLEKEPAPANAEVIVDLNYLREFTEGDPVRLQRLIDLFLKKVPVSLSAVQEAMDSGDYEKVRVAVHSMKPQLRFTGVMQALALAEAIESACVERTGLDTLPDQIRQLITICNQAISELTVRERI